MFHSICLSFHIRLCERPQKPVLLPYTAGHGFFIYQAARYLDRASKTDGSAESIKALVGSRYITTHHHNESKKMQEKEKLKMIGLLKARGR